MKRSVVAALQLCVHAGPRNGDDRHKFFFEAWVKRMIYEPCQNVYVERRALSRSEKFGMCATPLSVFEIK